MFWHPSVSGQVIENHLMPALGLYRIEGNISDKVQFVKSKEVLISWVFLIYMIYDFVCRLKI